MATRYKFFNTFSIKSDLQGMHSLHDAPGMTTDDSAMDQNHAYLVFKFGFLLELIQAAMMSMEILSKAFNGCAEMKKGSAYELWTNSDPRT